MPQHSGPSGVLRLGHQAGRQTAARGRSNGSRSRTAAWKVFSPTADEVLSAIALHTQAKIGFWDAMILLAAAESGCDVLWTEDLNDGQLQRGVCIRNPFAGKP